MNPKPIEVITHSPEETRRLGETIGRRIKGKTVIALIGELGAGKTALVQGLAKGLDVPETYYVTSPSYTLVNEYPGRLPLIHVDLYRLESPDDFEAIGLDDLLEQNSVTVIEWADKMTDGAFSESLTIRIDIGEEDSRRILMTGDL